jgi:hypothetical protein
MAYTPTMPPFSPSKTVSAVSPMSEILVPVVPAVPHESGQPQSEDEAGRTAGPIWPSDSEAAIHRFHGQPHARLFVFLGRKVRTPKGPGTLVQVFAQRVTVLLDSELRRCSWFRPAEVEPVSKDAF